MIRKAIILVLTLGAVGTFAVRICSAVVGSGNYINPGGTIDRILQPDTYRWVRVGTRLGSRV